jgi:hypothetical protein
MIAIILATPPRKARAEPVPLSANSRKPSSPLPGKLVAEATSCDFIRRRRRCLSSRQPTRRKYCAMSDLARCAEGARDIRTRRLHQFPVTLNLKADTELCCISSGITVLRKFYATQLDIWAARTASDRIVGRKTRRNPVLGRDTVSIRPKSVAIELAVVVVCRIFCLM